MYRIDDASASATLPIPEAALTEGYWTEGNPGSGVPATLERASWFNMMQEELRNIVLAGGLTPSKTTYTQVRDAIKSMFSPVVGAARNVSMSVSATSATGTLSADEVVVETALGGFPYKLASFSQAINLATTGAGGMDTGTVPTTGYVGLYAIFNPTTGARSLIAVNATSTTLPETYGGANMPSGFTASALVSVWAILASKFIVGVQTDRKVSFVGIGITFPTSTAAYVGLAITTAVPKNARSCGGYCVLQTNAGGTISLFLATNTLGVDGREVISNSSTSANSQGFAFADLMIDRVNQPQQIAFNLAQSPAAILTAAQVQISSFTF